jgi:hypothetical protein
MMFGPDDKLQQKINELLDRSDELFARSRNLIKDDNVVRDGELEAVIEESERLIEEINQRIEEQEPELP